MSDKITAETLTEKLSLLLMIELEKNMPDLTTVKIYSEAIEKIDRTFREEESDNEVEAVGFMFPSKDKEE